MPAQKVTPEVKADALARVMAGESAAAVAKEMGIAAGTLCDWKAKARDLAKVDEYNAKSLAAMGKPQAPAPAADAGEPKSEAPPRISTALSIISDEGEDVPEAADAGAVMSEAFIKWDAILAEDHKRTGHAMTLYGEHLIQAKAEVPHGEWLPLLGNRGMDKRSAQQLMKLAENRFMSDPDNDDELPGAWTTRAEVARVPAPVLDELQAEGLLETRSMTRDEAHGFTSRIRTAIDRLSQQRKIAPEMPVREQAKLIVKEYKNTAPKKPRNQKPGNKGKKPLKDIKRWLESAPTDNEVDDYFDRFKTNGDRMYKVDFLLDGAGDALQRIRASMPPLLKPQIPS